MIKKIILLIIIGMLLIPTGCGKTEDHVEKLGIRGIVTGIEKASDGRITWIMVEGEREEDTSYSRASIRVPEKISIINEAGEPLEMDDIWKGKMVEAWFTGPVAESEPVQAEAMKIKVLDELMEVSLDFKPQNPMVLQKGNPTEDLVYKETHDFTGNFDNEKVLIHIYQKNKQNQVEKLGMGEIYGYLEVNGKIYVIGPIANYGLNSFSIRIEDVNDDNSKEIVIDGIMGTTYVQSSIIGRDQEGDWMLWLQGGSYDVVDLDEDGIKEWVSTSRGSIPPYVLINRWREGKFEMVDVTEALGVNYARLKEKDQQWIIEAGVWKIEVNTSKSNVKTMEFIYQDGKLIEKRNNIDNKVS